MKLVLILVLMIVSVMAVVGTFLINSVSTFYIDSFYTQMQSVFTTDTIRSMQEAAAAPDAEGLKTIIDAHRSRLGIDDYRNYYILDGEGRFVDGSNPNLSVTRTRNIIAAMAGEAGTRSSVSDSVMDIAVPLDHDGNGTVDYIVYIADDKQEISDLSWRFFQIVMQAMMFGLLAAILLSFLLSKTITTPIERITEGARSIAEGNFDQDLGVQSSDEIGELTRSFNYMARRLKTTVGEVQGERDKLNTLFLHMTDGVAAFTTDGRLIHMNPATENLLGVRMQDSLTFDEMFEDLEMVGSDETAMRTFLTSEITRRGRVLSVTLAPYGALDGKGAHSTWVGNALIEPTAPGTDSYELNRNLVLTPGAIADSEPNLEIENGNIIGAGHASSVGRFDDEELFYLESRGISENEARKLVVRGFFGELVEEIGIPAISEHLMNVIDKRLARGESDAIAQVLEEK